MHYNGSIDIALHPRNQINAWQHIKHYVVLSPSEVHMCCY